VLDKHMRAMSLTRLAGPRRRRRDHSSDRRSGLATQGSALKTLQLVSLIFYIGAISRWSYRFDSVALGVSGVVI
jgi:hypothetical protein